jgi:multiple sugar transport system permease protein
MEKINRRQTAVCYLMMAPFAIFFICFVLVPILVSVALSLTNFNMMQAPSFAGLDNYMRMLLDDSVFLTSLKNTLLFALFTGPASYAACLFFAWLVNELGRKTRSLFTFLLYIPSMSSAVFTVWAFIFSGDKHGLLNSVLSRIGLVKDPVQWLSDPRYIMGSVIAVQLWLSLGTSFLSFIAGFKGIDPQQYEAAAIDGIPNRFAELWFITLPNMGPQLVFGAVMQIGASFAAGAVGAQLVSASGSAVSVVSASGSVAAAVSVDYAASTLATHMIEMATVRNEMGYACAIAVFLFAMMACFNAIIRKALRKI